MSIERRSARTRWLLGLAGLVVVAALILLFSAPPHKDSGRLPVKWKAQPDSFPLGTVLQGSTVEMSLGCFGDIRPAAPPAWFARLPTPVRPWASSALDRYRAAAVKSTWRIQVDAPDFLRVDRARIDYHPIHGAFPTVNLHLVADRPGSHDAPLTIRLIGRGYGATTLRIPVRVNVLAKPSRWAVLMTETPFSRYSTEAGVAFEPLAGVTSRLAERGARVDFRYSLPKSLDAWNVILLGEVTLCRLDRNTQERLHRFVARGGRLIVCADAFFVGTVPKANDLLQRYGLRIDSKDAGHNIRASRIAPDALTAGVSELGFFRPAAVWATDPRQAKVLAAMNDDEGPGFIVVSRGAGRGDVILLAQSLWWNWLKPERGGGDTARMLENLLAP
jgi:hypothetical protein